MASDAGTRGRWSDVDVSEVTEEDAEWSPEDQVPREHWYQKIERVRGWVLACDRTAGLGRSGRMDERAFQHRRPGYYREGYRDSVVPVVEIKEGSLEWITARLTLLDKLEDKLRGLFSCGVCLTSQNSAADGDVYECPLCHQWVCGQCRFKVPNCPYCRHDWSSTQPTLNECASRIVKNVADVFDS